MKRVRRIIALLVLALWWPATMHCQLADAFGAHTPHCDEAGAHHETTDADGCAVVEDGGYRSLVTHHAVTPKVLIVSADAWLVLAAILAEPRHAAPAPTTDAFERPRDWTCAWHFTRRAAAPARAPSLS